MTLKEAHALQAEIKGHGLHCVVPLGYGPNAYFARIYTSEGELNLQSVAEWSEYNFGREDAEP